ncbi:MAG: hypothetical protein GY814_17465 [Gammaproteobacteria bacterium]|nr:hypothetical protein [Gammaproteobacteria bacterium]
MTQSPTEQRHSAVAIASMFGMVLWTMVIVSQRMWGKVQMGAAALAEKNVVAAELFMIVKALVRIQENQSFFAVCHILSMGIKVQ